jgi:hypothetical protein
MAKQNKKEGIDLRQKLTADFVVALQADWDEHGKEIIVALRTKAPTKYAEIISRLAMPEPMPPPSDFPQCKSVDDIGRKLLEEVGVAEVAMTDDMIARAIEANEAFIARLQEIAEGN